MPVLTLEEMAIELKEEIGLAGEEKKPTICVFDPNILHCAILEYSLAELLEKVEIFWQSQFSRIWIEVGGINKWTHSGLIAVKKPVLLISELEVVPEEHPYSIGILQNLRRTVGLEDVPLIVISSADCLLRAYGEAGNKLGKLKVNQFFTWTDLEKETKEQGRLFDFVSQILGPKTEP